MAALAIPLLEGAGEAIAAAWSAFVSSGAATATAGGAATAAVLALPGDKAQDNDKAKAEAQANTRTRDRPCKCPPKKNGKPSPDLRMPAIARKYQDQVTEVTGYPKGIEWLLGGRRFDGFREPQCRLEEAKSNYDKFFDEDSGDPKYWWLNTGAAEMVETAGVQNSIALENSPCDLRWYFMEPISYRYMRKRFANSGYRIEVKFEPMQ
jgi:hypothetical protein